MATKQQLGNNFGHKKSKKSWAGMNLSERKRARTEYGQWKRSGEGKEGGQYYGVKPPKGWTAKSDKSAKSAMKAAPAKNTTAAKKVITKTPTPTKVVNTVRPTIGKGGLPAAKKDKVPNPKNDSVKPIGNYAAAGGVGSKSWSMLVDYKNANGRGTKRQTFTRAPSNMKELKAWWSGQRQKARYPGSNSGTIIKKTPSVTSAAMKRIAMRTWPKANWEWLK